MYGISRKTLVLEGPYETAVFVSLRDKRLLACTETQLRSTFLQPLFSTTLHVALKSSFFNWSQRCVAAVLTSAATWHPIKRHT